MDDKLSRQPAIGNRQIWLLLAYCLLHTAYCYSQNYTRVDTIPVKVNGNWLKNAWSGGHNYIQLSDIDLNGDGKKDLFVFDRTGHKVTTYINKGTPNTADYVDSSFKYASKFPHLEDWALLRDYNCDGKPDIFTYAITLGGVKVWKNTSTIGNLSFVLEKSYIASDYTPLVTTDPLSNLYITRVDIPTIDDIDGDGDLDILTFDYSSVGVEFHINKSKELGYNCDSLIFIVDPNGCWGNFQEDAFNCGINLASCRTINSDSLRKANAGQQDERHSGSCSLCLDMDADGDKEIIIGDISCCTMNMLTNGGTAASANIVAKDTVFPSSDISVRMNLFPCGFFVDVDNDNKRDLIVAPNAPNVSVNNESIWFYKNTGADNAPVFSRTKRNLFQDEMIEVGEGADPVFFDFNDDGAMDLLVSGYIMTKDSCPSSNSYGVYAYKNIGMLNDPQFELVSTDYANLTTVLPNLPGKHLTFGDVDDDGDSDMILGDYNGNIHYLNNTAGTSVPANFVYVGMVRDLATANDTFIDIGSYATPQLIDVDRDSRLDLVVGERSGNLNYFRNIGTASSFSFSLTSATFGGVDVKKPCCTGYSVPFMYDSAGKYNLIVSSEANRNYPASGWLWYFKNIDANLAGNFTLVDSLYKNIWEGERMAVHGADINGDGKKDLAIGNYAGGVTIYMGDSNLVPVQEHHSASFDFSLYPNPSSGISSLEIMQFIPQEKYFLTIFNSLGETVHTQTITRQRSLIEKNMNTGIYHVELSNSLHRITKKIVVLK